MVTKFSKKELERIGRTDDEIELVIKYQKRFPIILDNEDNIEKFCIDARQLYHEIIQSDDMSNFSRWIKRAIKNYGFVENSDFSMISPIGRIKEFAKGGDVKSKTYTLSVDMAKQLAMIDKKESGFIARKYFILMEKIVADNKDWLAIRDPEKVEYKKMSKEIDAWCYRIWGHHASRSEYAVEADMLNRAVLHGYLYDEYCQDAIEILNRRGTVDCSVELCIRELSFNTANKTLQLDDFYVSGLTLLSKDVSPGMAGSNFKIEDFAVNAETVTFNTDNKLVETLEKLTNILESFDINQKSKEGGINNKMTKFEELLAKYGKTAEDVTFNYAEMSDEELEAKFAEMFDDDNSDGDNSDNGESGEPSNDGEGNDEGTSDPNGDEGGSQTFEKIVRTYEISHEDIRYALYQLLSEYEAADNEWYFINAVYDDRFTYENWNGDKVFGQNYTKDGDNVAFDGERYNLHRELLTDSEFAELQSMRSNYAALKEFKETAEKNELHAKREEILANENFASISEKDEEGKFINKDFEKLYTNMDNYSLEDLEKEAKLIYADSNMKTFAAITEKTQKKTTVKVFANVNKSKKDNRYGNLFSK